MKYISTRDVDKSKLYSFEDAVLAGWADDGGMLLPASMPNVSDKLAGWAKLTYPQLCEEILALFVDDDIPRSDLKAIVEAALGDFGSKNVVEVSEVEIAAGRPAHILELWHGRTLAFKDLGLQITGQIFDYILKKRNRRVTLLIGTSGDTGSAAIEAVRGLDSVDIVVLYPANDRITDIQEQQMLRNTSEERNARRNVYVIGVDGTSDDLDAPIMAVFGDAPFKHEHAISSVNSVNICRILVQVVHYFYAYLRVNVAPGQRPDFYIPTGAAGNVTSAMLAKEMLARFIGRGDLSVSADIIRTKAVAMDIQVPYNIERMLYLAAGGDATVVGATMRAFYAAGRADVPPAALEALRGKYGVRSQSASDADIVGAIRQLHAQSGYIVDPHTACAVAVALKESASAGSPPVCVACAHPAKFLDTVGTALGCANRDAARAAIPDQAHPHVQAVLGLLAHAEANANTEKNREERSPHMQHWPGPVAEWEARLRALVLSITEKRDAFRHLRG